jgi:hypothetical protein
MPNLYHPFIGDVVVLGVLIVVTALAFTLIQRRLRKIETRIAELTRLTSPMEEPLVKEVRQRLEREAELEEKRRTKTAG